MKSPLPKDDVSLKKKAHGGDFSLKKKSPSPKVNISPKLNIWGDILSKKNAPFSEVMSLYK
jgi:hypothetical protein